MISSTCNLPLIPYIVFKGKNWHQAINLRFFFLSAKELDYQIKNSLLGVKECFSVTKEGFEVLSSPTVE